MILKFFQSLFCLFSYLCFSLFLFLKFLLLFWIFLFHLFICFRSYPTSFIFNYLIKIKISSWWISFFEFIICSILSFILTLRNLRKMGFYIWSSWLNLNLYWLILLIYRLLLANLFLGMLLFFMLGHKNIFYKITVFHSFL
jgi:hypothetical protein